MKIERKYSIVLGIEFYTWFSKKKEKKKKRKKKNEKRTQRKRGKAFTSIQNSN